MFLKNTMRTKWEFLNLVDGNNNGSELIQRTVMQYDCAGDLFDCYRLGVCDFVKGLLV